MLPYDRQNLEGHSIVRVQPSNNLYQNIMKFNVPHNSNVGYVEPQFSRAEEKKRSYDVP